MNFNDEQQNGKPPRPFTTWKQMYAVVLGELGFLIILFCVITEVFS